MKRISCVLVFCLVSYAAVLQADPPAREMASELGYKEPDLLMDLPIQHGKRAPKDQCYRNYREDLRKVETDFHDAMQPKMYDRPEAARMIPYLLDLHKKQPVSPKITRKLALTCLGAGQPREALHWFTQTFHRDRSDLNALWNMSVLAYRLGETKAAEAYLREYSMLDPYSAWGRMAKEFIKSGRFGGAELASGFQTDRARVGEVGASNAPGTASGSGRIMVIENRNPNDSIGKKFLEMPVSKVKTVSEAKKAPRPVSSAIKTDTEPTKSALPIEKAKIDEQVSEPQKQPAPSKVETPPTASGTTN